MEALPIAALLLSLLALGWQAVTWWHREWIRVSVVAVIAQSRHPTKRVPQYGVRVTNRGRIPVRVRRAGLTLDLPGGSFEQSFPLRKPIELPAGASEFLPAGHVDDPGPAGIGAQKFFVLEGAYPWADLDNGAFVTGRTGYEVQSTSRASPVYVGYFYRPEDWWERFLEVWFGITPRTRIGREFTHFNPNPLHAYGWLRPQPRGSSPSPPPVPPVVFPSGPGWGSWWRALLKNLRR